MKRIFSLFSGLFLLLSLVGCGSGESTDPNKLTPLTDEQKAAIKAQDTQVDAEESNTGGIVPKRGTPRKGGG